jgi:hypothetical protein
MFVGKHYGLFEFGCALSFCLVLSVERVVAQEKPERVNLGIPDVADKSYQVMIKTLSPNGSASDAAVENVIQQTLKANKSQKQVSHAQVVNLGFLDEAQRELGLR